MDINLPKSMYVKSADAPRISTLKSKKMNKKLKNNNDYLKQNIAQTFINWQYPGGQDCERVR